jgi:hypothetical protein
MIKKLNTPEGITTHNMYVPNKRTSEYRKQKLIKIEDKSASIVRLNYLSVTDRSSRQKISKNITELTSTECIY